MSILAQPSVRWLMLILAACALTTTALASHGDVPNVVHVEPQDDEALLGLLPGSADPTAMVLYEMDTGVVRRAASSDPSQLPAPGDHVRVEPYLPTDLLEQGGDNAGAESVIGGDGRTRITETTEFPWRSLVKIYYQLAGEEWMCTGAFVDEDHVLTAGHCVYDRDAAGGVGAWATNMWVVPAMNNGWDTDGFLDRPLKNAPYGAARATDARTYDAWISSESMDHDWAVLTLDRPVGSFTGWMGRNTMSPAHANYVWYTGVLNTAGYPGDRDGGRNLYFDSDVGCAVSDTRHHYTMDTGGGQSGMPVWYRDPTEASINRYILTVHAYGVGGADCGNSGTRLNQDKYDRINTWRNADAAAPSRADVFQFIPNDATRSAPYRTLSTISDTLLSVGEPLSITTTLRNAGTSSTGTFYVNFYLSTNNIISGSDRFIGSVPVSSMSAFSNRDVTLNVGLPANVSSNTYYVGWIIDPDNRASEYDETDNTVIMRDGNDFVRIKVDRTVPPAPNPTDGIDGWSQQTSRTFTWPIVNDANGIGTYQYRLNGGAEVSIGNVTTYTLHGLATGEHDFSLRAVDGAGNVGPWATHAVHVDVTAPSRPFALGPEGWTGDVTPRVYVEAIPDPGSGVQGFEYRFGGSGTWTDVGLVAHFDLPSRTTANWTVQVRAYDGVGLRSPARELYVRVDATAPAAPTVTLAPAAWTNLSGATFSWSGNDDHSGIDRYEIRLGHGQEWLPVSDSGIMLEDIPEDQYLFQLRAIDRVGLVSPATEHAFGVDFTPPGAPAFLHADGAWFNESAVTLRWSASADALSGLAAYDWRFVGHESWTPVGGSTQVALDPLEEGEHAVELRARDNAGNPSDAVNATFRIDVTQPDVTMNLSASPNAHGWYRVSVKLNGTASDALSGLASFACTYNGAPFDCARDTWFTSTRVYNVRAVATDHAGNQRTWEQAIRVDKLAPTLYANFTPSAPNAAGWYNTTVSMDVSAGDAISGVDSVTCRQNGVAFDCTSTIMFTDTLGSSLAFTALDRAGLSTSSSRTLRIDTAPPAVAISLDPATPRGANGWHNSTVTVRVAASDEGSGLASLACTRNETAFDCAQPLVLDEPGHHGIKVVATDVAGHRREATREVRVDAVAPVLTLNMTPADPNGQNGWHTVSVRVNASAYDGYSGLASLVCTQNGSPFDCAAETWFANTRVYTVRVVATDHAGNVAEIVRELKVDKANPACAVNVGGGTNGAGHYVGSATAYLNATDTGSGVATVEYRINGGARTAYTTPIAFGPGTYTLVCLAADNAGRTVSTTRSFTVV